MLSLANFSGLCYDVSVDDKLVKNVVDIRECSCVGRSDSQSLNFIEGPVSEEICCIRQYRKVSGCGSNIEQPGLKTQNTVKSIIFSFSELSIEHQIGHRVIWISVEVALNVYGSLIKRFVVVTFISFQLMGVNKMIDEFQYTFFKTIDFHSAWINIEWEMVISANTHEVIVQVEQREEERALLDITP